MEVGVVQRIDVGAKALAQGPGQLALVANCGDGFQVRPQRRQALRFDGSLVHVRVVERRDLADLGAGRSFGLRRLLNQADRALVAQIVEGGEDADPAAVGRNLGALDPAAVGVPVKVFARGDRGVHIGHGDAVGLSGANRGERDEDSRKPGFVFHPAQERSTAACRRFTRVRDSKVEAGLHGALLSVPPWASAHGAPPHLHAVPRCARAEPPEVEP